MRKSCRCGGFDQGNASVGSAHRGNRERYIPEQKAFIARWFEEIWKPFRSFFRELQGSEYYRKLGDVRKHALSLCCFFHIFDCGAYRAFCDTFESEQIFRDRPNGGKWIAFGHVDMGEASAVSEAHKYSYAGQSNVWLENYLDAERIRMSLFYPEGFPIRLFNRGEDRIPE